MTKILVEHAPSPMKLEVLNVEDWVLVKRPVGVHLSSVTASQTFYIEEGDAEIIIDGELPVEVSGDDLLTIMSGTDCAWHITTEMTLYCQNT